MKELTTLIFVGCLLIACPTASAQVEQFTLSSNILNEDREVYVQLPLSYDPQAKYPVVFLTDAQFHFNMVSDALQMLYQGGFPKVILVGIPHKDRLKDLTASKTDESPTSGGALSFLRFIKEELLPELSAKYAISKYKVLMGHSAGGLFSVFAMVNEPLLFNAHIAITPTVRWDNLAIFKTFPVRFFDDFVTQKKRLFLGLGNEVGKEREGVVQLKELFESHLADSPQFTYTEFLDESHSTVPWVGYWAGLKTVFGAFKLSNYRDLPLDDIVKYYARVGAEYDADIRVPQRILLDLGTTAMEKKEYSLAKIIFEYYSENYPKIPFPKRYLGDIHFEQGNFKTAKNCYLQALDIFPSEYVKSKIAEIDGL
ncbi:alpha/beta hydrolase-fold protein [Spongiimicrobium sp. 3-5]|uniref:alpha/beta hydrolase-fold protein n=1 Tax=Spongiimicrobium sp. 3-5 TaxID=3332596 RepID=UPI00397FFA91